MGHQIADDAARHMKRVWLGPGGSWRWPFDATFTQWGIGAAAALALAVLTWRVVPVGLLALAAGWVLGARVGPLVAPGRPGAMAWAVRVAVWLLAALLAPSLRALVLPLPIYLAIPVGALLAVAVVRAFGAFVNWNRPVSYWLALPVRVASGPRAGEPTEIELDHLLPSPPDPKAK